MRTAIKARLATAYSGTSWHAYAKAYGNELMPAFIVHPVPRSGGWYLSRSGTGSDADCPIAYTFTVEVWAPIGGGVDKAEDMIDRIISPAGTDALSMAGVLENVSGTYNGDSLDVLVGGNVAAIAVDQFQSRALAALNNEGANAILARVPVEVYV